MASGTHDNLGGFVGGMTSPMTGRNASLGIHSFDLLIFALSLLLIFKKVWMWRNRSHRSFKKSDHERSTLNFFKKEQCQWFNHDSRESCLWQFFLLLMPKEWIAPVILHSFLKTNGINSLSLLFTKEQQWVNRSHQSLKKSDGRDSIPSFFTKRDRRDSLFSQSNRSSALSVTKNELFAQKTEDLIPNPGWMSSLIFKS